MRALVPLVKFSCTPAFWTLVPLGIGSCTTGLAVVVFVKVTSFILLLFYFILEKRVFASAIPRNKPREKLLVILITLILTYG